MGELKVPYQVVKDLIDSQNKFNEAQLALLGIHLEKCAALFELALNPPLPIQPPDNHDEELFANPRMSEEEEDLRYAFQLGDITQEELDQRLKAHLNGSYAE